MAGYTVNGQVVANEVGNAALALRNALEKVRLVKLWLDDQTDAVLLASPYNMSQADINLTRAAMTDLDKLRLIGAAAAVQATASDFWFNARHVTGLN